ncbi:MAG TPA: glycosyltransferase family 4 protein [Allosphingosinicella sp.]|nr:glycosyltransferase family 4 protein [Allosphingosinicella sp.]
MDADRGETGAEAGESGAKQRIVLFGSYAPSLVNFRGALIAELTGLGHDVFALAPDIDAATATAVRALGAEPVEVPLGRTSLNPLEAARTVRHLRRALGRIRPHLVIAYTIKPIVLAARALRRRPGPGFVPMITGLGYALIGGSGAKRLLVRRLALPMYRRALRRADLVIFQNPDDRRDFERLGLLPPATPVGMISGSGVDVRHFAPAPLPPGAAFLMISRFLRDKGISEFGEAARRIRAEHPEVAVRLAGWLDASPDSIGVDELAAIEAGGVENLGMLADVRTAIADCSVYVLPSYREGTPRSVLEAMAMGRAILTTDAPGCRETVIEGENGLMVPPGDADSLYRAMKRFVEEPHLRASMGAASRRLAESRFDVAAVNRVLLGHLGLAQPVSRTDPHR